MCGLDEAVRSSQIFSTCTTPLGNRHVAPLKIQHVSNPQSNALTTPPPDTCPPVVCPPHFYAYCFSRFIRFFFNFFGFLYIFLPNLNQHDLFMKVVEYSFLQSCRALISFFYNLFLINHGKK